MTRQEYYDLLVRSARDGTFPSVRRINGHQFCEYIGEGKKRCAVGVLLPDHVAKVVVNTRWNTGSVRPASSHFAIHGFNVEDAVDEMTLDDLSKVQNAHDNAALTTGGFDIDDFILALNRLSCFADVKKVEA